MTRQAANLLTDDDKAEWDRLVVWYATWEPPTTPYDYCSGVRVLDPAKSHAYYRARIAEGVSGQVQVGVLDWLQRHFTMFGEKKKRARKKA